MTHVAREAAADRIELFWLPLGAGAPRIVARSGRAFEALVAAHEHRGRCDLFHSALEVHLGGVRHVIEMAPVWDSRAPDRGVVCEGPVGSRLLGRSRLFRYEVRRWRDGVIPDRDQAVGGRQVVSEDADLAWAVLALAPAFPTATWGRDEQHAGEMWNSNSLTSWLLSTSGHDLATVAPPRGGRAPGWSAGQVVVARARAGSVGPGPVSRDYA